MTLHTRKAYLNIPTHIVYSGTTVNYTPILLCLHICLRDYVSTYPRKYPAHTLFYLYIPIKSGCSFLHLTLCNIKRLREREVSIPIKEVITSEM